MLTKPEVLDEDAVPEHELVVHRQDEIRRLRRTITGESAGIAYLFGPPGTGKTMCARLVADHLSPPGHTRSVHVNCWDDHDRHGVLFSVADGLCNTAVHRQSTGRGTLTDLIHDLDDADRWVICDEADQLRDKAVLYTLFESELNLIIIGNSEDDFFSGMEERLQSRLAVGRRIQFPAYSATEISAILQARADAAFSSRSVISDGQLDWIAERAEGDARKAIRTLREAAELAGEHRRDRGRYVITEKDLRDALPRAFRELQRKAWDQLHDHQQTLFEILREHGPLSPGTLYERYEGSVDEPRAKRTVRNYLSKMEHYNYVEASGAKQSRTWDAIPFE
ncbi:Cdc6/Cdc18 family protein [Halosimplex sp. J119]